jgi:NAD+ kinase
MPIELVLVRHGESEGNVANHASKRGDNSHFTHEFRSRHNSSWRLTPLGVEQAQAAGLWLKENINEGVFDGNFVSSYARARQTAGKLDLPEALWRVDDQLREQEWGMLDVMTDEERWKDYPHAMRLKKINPYYWSAQGGENMSGVGMRLRSGIIDTLHREYSEKTVVLVSHGNVMWSLRYMLERMLPEQYLALGESHDPHERINNCQILHYSRRNPETGDIEPHLNWLKSVCPWDLKRSKNTWVKIERKKFTNEELLKSVENL